MHINILLYLILKDSSISIFHTFKVCPLTVKQHIQQNKKYRATNVKIYNFYKIKAFHLFSNLYIYIYIYTHQNKGLDIMIQSYNLNIFA